MTTIKEKINEVKPPLMKALKSDHGFTYVVQKEIVKFHGKDWYKRWLSAFGPGNTQPIITIGDSSNPTKKEVSGVYYWDYERYADLVDFHTPTYFD